MPNDLSFAPTAQAQNFISTRCQPEARTAKAAGNRPTRVEDQHYDDGLVHGHSWATTENNR